MRKGLRRRAHKEGGWGCSALTRAGAVHARGLAAGQARACFGSGKRAPGRGRSPGLVLTRSFETLAVGLRLRVLLKLSAAAFRTGSDPAL